MSLIGVQNGEARFAGVESGKREKREKREKYGTGKYIPVFPVLPKLSNKLCRQGVQNELDWCPKWGRIGKVKVKIRNRENRRLEPETVVFNSSLKSPEWLEQM